MIIRGGKRRDWRKGVSNDVNLFNDVIIEREVSSPSHDVNNDVVKEPNKAQKDPKQTL